MCSSTNFYFVTTILSFLAGFILGMITSKHPTTDNTSQDESATRDEMRSDYHQ